MCGRYTLMTDEEYTDIRKIVQQVQDNLYGKPLAQGEIFPSNLAPVISCLNGQVKPEAAIWGFPNFRNKGVIINARSETVTEKPLFRKGFLSTRCVVPTTGYYEWDAHKQKHLFRLPENNTVYLAGLCGSFKGEKRYVILTAAANASVRGIHDRMPVIVPKPAIGRWLQDTAAALAMLEEKMPALCAQRA